MFHIYKVVSPVRSEFKIIFMLFKGFQERSFSICSVLFSHIGSAPLHLIPSTTLSISNLQNPRIITKGNKTLKLSKSVKVEGPLGSISMDIPNFIGITQNATKAQVSISIENKDNKIQRSMWGTVRSLLNNHIVGVNEGHMAILKFVGTGYRTSIENDGKFVSVKVGASISQGLPVPDGIKVKSPIPTLLIIEGCNKQQVNLYAARLRKFHPPEPYKGKGIYVNDETIKLKDKKIK